jgi:hypothetical protein
MVGWIAGRSTGGRVKCHTYEVVARMLLKLPLPHSSAFTY